MKMMKLKSEIIDLEQQQQSLKDLSVEMSLKHGRRKKLTRESIKNSKEILKIDPSIEDFKSKLSLQQACQEFGNLTGCNCVTDCSVAARCSCKVARIYCITLCHKGRGKNKCCTLFADLCCPEEEQEDPLHEEESI